MQSRPAPRTSCESETRPATRITEDVIARPATARDAVALGRSWLPNRRNRRASFLSGFPEAFFRRIVAARGGHPPFQTNYWRPVL